MSVAFHPFMREQPRYLDTYLADHHAGSVGALGLMDRMLKSNAGEPIHPVLDKLRNEIDEDKAALERICDALEVRSSSLKDGVARAAAALGQLKLNGQLTGYSPLSRLLELEGLRSGVAGKRCLWKALSVHARRDSRLQAFDIEELTRRADRQLADIDKWHEWASERLSEAMYPAELRPGGVAADSSA